MDQIDISSEDLEDGEVPDSDEDITIINIVPLEKSKILRYHPYNCVSTCNTVQTNLDLIKISTCKSTKEIFCCLSFFERITYIFLKSNHDSI